MSGRNPPWQRAYTHVALSPRSHKSLLDYCKTQGFNATFEALQQEAGQEGFVSDPKAKYAGLLEKKWTSVIRLQKKVGNGAIVEPATSSLTQPRPSSRRSWSSSNETLN